MTGGAQQFVVYPESRALPSAEHHFDQRRGQSVPRTSKLRGDGGDDRSGNHLGETDGLGQDGASRDEGREGGTERTVSR